MENKQDWRDMMCSGCRKVDKSYCYPCGAIRITEAEIAAAVAKEREMAKPLCDTLKEICDCNDLGEERGEFSGWKNSYYRAKAKSALKNYEEGCK